MKLIKDFIKMILRMISGDLEVFIVDFLYLRRLNRKPPELMWKSARPGPYARLDAGGACLNEKLYVFGGFGHGSTIYSIVNVFDSKKGKWVDEFDMPAKMAQSHQGLVSDGKRYIYEVSGQLGDQCRPPTADCFVLDVETKTWSTLPPLAEARYAVTLQLWRGRLHAIGGSKTDRNTPSTDHWSIAVECGKSPENQWRKEPSIPRGGPHRASAVVDDRLYVFGGQEGDYIAIPGDANYTCTGDLTNEVVFADTYMLPYGEKKWQRMADMPIKVSHTEFSIVIIGPYVVILGGMDNKDPDTKRVTVINRIQVYDTRNDTWDIVGHLPYGIKSTVAAYVDGWLYMTTGQRDHDIDDRSAGNYDRRVWRAKFSLKL